MCLAGHAALDPRRVSIERVDPPLAKRPWLGVVVHAQVGGDVLKANSLAEAIKVGWWVNGLVGEWFSVGGEGMGLEAGVICVGLWCVYGLNSLPGVRVFTLVHRCSLADPPHLFPQGADTLLTAVGGTKRTALLGLELFKPLPSILFSSGLRYAASGHWWRRADCAAGPAAGPSTTQNPALAPHSLRAPTRCCRPSAAPS